MLSSQSAGASCILRKRKHYELGAEYQVQLLNLLFIRCFLGSSADLFSSRGIIEHDPASVPDGRNT